MLANDCWAETDTAERASGKISRHFGAVPRENSSYLKYAIDIWCQSTLKQLILVTNFAHKIHP